MKNKSKNIKKENYNYCYKQLEKNLPIDQYGVNMKVGQAHNMVVNSDSIAALNDFYKKEIQGKISEKVNKKESVFRKDTIESIKRAFKETLEVDVQELKINTHTQYGMYFETISGHARNGESEWVVFSDEDKAEAEALAIVREYIEYEPETFNQDFLSYYVYITDTNKKIIASEEADAKIDNLTYNGMEELMEEANMLKEWEEIKKKMDKVEDKTSSEYGDLAIKLSELESDADEKVREEFEKEMMTALDDPIDYFVEELGAYSIEDLFQATFINIDIDKAAKDAVNVDGAAHFLDHYDNQEEEIKDPETNSTFYAYGTN